ncbi:hypothetical protein ACYSNX_02065 [Myroides sp. LJL115]
MNSTKLIILFVILTSFFSCSDDSQQSHYRISSIEDVLLQAEHSTLDVKMNQDDWVITGVYSLNGQAITDGGKPLQLTGTGTLTSNWFKITRDLSCCLQVDVFENYDQMQRGMIIKIANGTHNEKIKITQLTSEGYQFKEIEYYLKQESTFYTTQSSDKLIYNNYSPEANSVVIYPYSGERQKSYFISEQQGAFNWVGEKQVVVKVPVDSSENHFYKTTPANYTSPLSEINFSLDCPPLKQLKVYVDIEYSKQTYDYILTLVNNRTKEEKQIKGQWIIEQPISYKTTVEAGQLP